jgi:tetratricopeptide (TPR) repeat protein
MSAAIAFPSELTKQNPWPGLRAFGENDRDFFFGREREGAELLSLIQRAPVVVLYGQSGLGKTSLLQAGLFPKLKVLNFFPVRVRFDHGDDAPPLARQITLAVAEELDRAQITGPRPVPGETLWEYFHRRDVDFWGPRNRLLTPVIVLDQFEEIFTLGHRSEKSNARVAEFQKELEAVLEHRPPDAVRERLEADPDKALHYDLKRQAVKFVITLREDFLADLDPWRERMPSLLPDRFRLERMTGEQALEVVQRAGSDVVDPAVARDIVDFVSTSRIKRSSSLLEQRDVDPALLSVVCDGLNLSRISRGKTRITADLLTAEREEIMKDFYGRTFQDVDPRVRDWVEDRLLTSSGYRDRAALDDATKLGLPEADFDVLVNRRLLHREERSGVLWLELTHDSLTDPASRSRAVREQRMQAEAAKEREKAAAEREAQVRSKLRRTQLLVAGFGLLLIVALIESYAVWRQYRVTVAQDEVLRATHKTMVEEKGLVDAKDAELHTVREKNEANFKKQVAAAGSLFDMRVPTATVINIIQITDTSFITHSIEHTSSNDIDLPHARFLAQAAGALYQVGHYDEGLKYANRAMDLVRGNGKPGDSQDRLLLTRAEALYARGAGLLATGRLGEARQCFEEAVKLSAGTPEPDSKQDMARVFVLSHIGLGEVAAEGYRYGEARDHYERVLNFIKQSGSNADEDRYWEDLYWQVLAMRGLSLCQTDDLKAQPYITQANDVVRRLMTHDPGNVRWKSLFTEISYYQGFAAAFRLDQYDIAKNFLEQSKSAGEDLCQRDSENREWRLNLARILRGLGLVHFYQGELAPAEKLLKQGEESARELNGQQPSWTRAARVRGLLVMAVADVQEKKHSRSPDASNDLNSVFDQYSQARALFQRSKESAPGALFFDDDVAEAATRQGNLRELQAVELRQKDGKDKQAQDLANQRDVEALDFYAQAFKALEPLESIAKSDPSIVQERADLYRRTGDIQRSLKEPAKAITAYDKSVTTLTALVKMAPSPENYHRLSVSLGALGDTYEDSHETSQAYSQYSSAMEALTKALAARPEDAELNQNKAVVQSRISDVWFDRGNLENALTELGKAFDTVWRALEYDYSGATLNSNLKFYQDRLARIRKRVTDKPDAGSQPTNLTPEASQALLHRIDALAAKTDPSKLLDRNQRQANWGLRTLMPGAWRILAAAELTAPLQHLLAIDKNVTSDQVQGIRKTALDFYEDAALYEAEVKMPDGKDGIVSYVQRGTEWVLLEGTATIENMNNASAPKLDTPDRALAYLRFYVGSKNDPDRGRWRLIDHAEDVDWFASASGGLRANLAGKIRPLILESSSDKEWQAIGTVQFGDNFWEASFHLSRDGVVKIPPYDKQIGAELPVFLDAFSNEIRAQQTMELLNHAKPQRDLAKAQKTLAANPKDEEALRLVPGLYYGMKRWKEAVEAEKNWVAFLQRQTKRDDDWSKNLFGAYVPLSWYQLIARDFTGAFASSDEARKLDPSRLIADEAYAHALLFLGRTQEAEALYLGNVGKKMDSKSNQTWEQSVLADFSSLEKEGITNPEIARISKLLIRTQNERLETQFEQQLKTNPNDESALRQLPNVYYNLGRWNEAVDAEKTRIAFIQRQTKHDSDWSKTMAGAYVSLSWYQLFARDFAGALASSDEAINLDRTNLAAETNHAHALLFLDRAQEAEAIYLQHRGEKVFAGSDEKWEQAILTDFDDLEKAGITHPEFARLRVILKPPSK